MKALLWVACAAVLAAGCADTATRRMDEAVAYHLRMADSLEQEMALREAAHHYAAIADEYPQSSAYPTAVKKAALLYANEFNDARNDSLALRWFTAYLDLPLKKPERENVQAFISLFHRMKGLHEELARKTDVADSLGVASRRQGTALSSDARRIQELEGALQQAQGELKKIKEIDLGLSRNRVRK
jgi:hypothetical protein